MLLMHLNARMCAVCAMCVGMFSQTGTSDTVEMLGEEEVWEVESSRELVPLGWIHTHPTQVNTTRLYHEPS